MSENQSPCCEEADCHRRRPFLFMKTPDPENRWLLVTHYHVMEGATEGDRSVKVLERHDVTRQIETILLQYREFLDAELQAALSTANEAELERVQNAAPKLYLPGDR